MDQLLAIDIGNTNIRLGIFNGSRLVRRYSFATDNDHYRYVLKRILKNHDVENAIVCSVVPKVAGTIGKYLAGLSGIRVYFVGRDIKVPLKNLYRDPGQVGQDRLVNAYAALDIFCAPLVIVDLGTAVTFDVVSKNKEYLGGMILPGLQASLDILALRGALLPQIKLGKPPEFIGRNTKNSMLSGVVYGFTSLLEGVTGSIKEKIGKNAKVIGTGGDIGLIATYCRIFDKVDQDLTLKGLQELYQAYNPLSEQKFCVKIRRIK